MRNRTQADYKALYNAKPLLKLDTYRIYPLSSKDDYERSFNYSINSFTNSDFTYDDIIFEKAIKTDRQKQRNEQHRINQLRKDERNRLYHS